MTKLIHVAAAVITDASGNILIAKRPDDKHQGGLWEFPGGKVETGEPVVEALARELDEELGIQLTHSRPLIKVPYHYPDKSVLLDVHVVDSFEGQPFGREGQPVQWVSPTELDGYAFPAANKPILSAALLPPRLMITADVDSVEALSQQLERQLQSVSEQGAVMLRAPKLDEPQLVEAIKKASSLCKKHGRLLIVNTGLALAEAQSLPAVHLSSPRLQALGSRAEFKGRWLGASCHNLAELQMAVDKGLDYVTLSPVQPTASHPDQSELGWSQFIELANAVPLPVYGLGGLVEADLQQVWQSGGQGIAAIRAWWPKNS